MISQELMTSALPPIKVTETGSDALYYMDEYKVSFLPVLDGQLYLGLLSESDIFKLADPDMPLAQQKVPYRLVYVNETQHIFDVIKIMSSEKITILPVLDENKFYKGCISIINLAEQFGKFTAFVNPGAIIILELNQNDYVLSQIAQIVESQDTKILSLYVSSEIDSTKMELTIKLNKFEIQSLINALTRYNYTIKATFTDDEKMVDDLLERYNALMNYLKI
jgi:CBS domain-containing protein